MLQQISILSGGGSKIRFKGKSLQRITSGDRSVEVWQNDANAFVAQIVIHPRAAGERAKHAAEIFSAKENVVQFVEKHDAAMAAQVASFFHHWTGPTE